MTAPTISSSGYHSRLALTAPDSSRAICRVLLASLVMRWPSSRIVEVRSSTCSGESCARPCSSVLEAATIEASGVRKSWAMALSRELRSVSASIAALAALASLARPMRSSVWPIWLSTVSISRRCSGRSTKARAVGRSSRTPKRRDVPLTGRYRSRCPDLMPVPQPAGCRLSNAHCASAGSNPSGPRPGALAGGATRRCSSASSNTACQGSSLEISRAAMVAASSIVRTSASAFVNRYRKPARRSRWRALSPWKRRLAVSRLTSRAASTKIPRVTASCGRAMAKEK